MIPINPSSSLTRPRAFVQEEWDAMFSRGRATKDGPEGVNDVWRGILHANLALADPRESFNFFRDGVDGHWDDRWVDGSASRTWYLVWAAGLMELESRKAPPVTGSRLQMAREREMRRKQGKK
jgi:endo-1,3(4)-beta-glucanase